MRSLLVVAVLLSSVALADRLDKWLSSSAGVYKVELTALPDGGCSMEAYGKATRSDGAKLATPLAAELTGSERGTCLEMLRKASALWKAKEKL